MAGEYETDIKPGVKYQRDKDTLTIELKEYFEKDDRIKAIVDRAVSHVALELAIAWLNDETNQRKLLEGIQASDVLNTMLQATQRRILNAMSVPYM